MKAVRAAAVAAATLVTCPTVHAELIVNGGFETGDFTGWDLSPGSNAVAGASPIAPHTGDFAAQIEAGTTLSQTVPTVPGLDYRVDFWTFPAARIVVFWAGFDVFESGNAEWLNAGSIATAIGPSLTVSFVVPSGTGTTAIDDVSVLPFVIPERVPEPASVLILLTSLGVLGLVTLSRLHWPRPEAEATAGHTAPRARGSKP